VKYRRGRTAANRTTSIAVEVKPPQYRPCCNCGVAIAEFFLSTALLGMPGPAVPCGPSHVATLARTRTTRIYERPRTDDEHGPATYVCVARRKPVRLDEPDDSLYMDEVARRPIVLNRRYAAYAVNATADEGIAAYDSTDVWVTDAIRRRNVVSCGCRAFFQAEFSHNGTVRALVLTDRGSIAWIGRGRLIALDERGHRKLDRRAVSESLRLRGHRIFWRTRDGVHRADTLRGSPHGVDSDL
jgi:hypothetical protein